MTMQGCMGEFGVEFFEQHVYCCFLRLSSSICRGLAIYSKATDIADTDTMAVLANTMRARLFERSPFVYAAITIDHIVISDIAESSCEVPLADLLYGEILARRGCRAVKDYFGNRAHVF